MNEVIAIHGWINGSYASRSPPNGANEMRSSAVNRLLVGVIVVATTASAKAQLWEEDQHSIRWHRPSQLSTARRVPGFVPVTVATKDAVANERLLPLDEAIRIALQHSEVIRTLNSTVPSSFGATIYDTAIASTPIDRAIATFDPVFSANSSWRKSENPRTFIFPGVPGVGVAGSQFGGSSASIALRRRNRMGGTAGVEYGNNFSYGDFPQGHRNEPRVELSYTQPLLSGAGVAVNEAPIVIARINQDRSYFQYKQSVQRLVSDVISAYWSLVSARTELWAREKQVEQAQESLDQSAAMFKNELADIGEVAQPRLALANFKAQLISARGDVIQQEANLRNLLGLPPEDGNRLVPSTPPTRDRLRFDWQEMVQTAQQFRPDLIELHLVQAADRQRLIQADNQAQPELEAFAVQGWNGISGHIPFQGRFSEGGSSFPNWTLGVRFEVPISLRAARATVRSSELQLATDQANIRQGLHATEHLLATTIRNLDQSYEQYEAFRETRAAALTNLQVQLAEKRAGRVIFLDVLQAITAWGDAVASEALSLTSYNASLAALEEETGTILETHNVTFAEEQYGSIGAWGKHFRDECYPRSLQPQRNGARYPDGVEPSEEAFELEDVNQKDIRERLGETTPVSVQRVLPDADGQGLEQRRSPDGFQKARPAELENAGGKNRIGFGRRLKSLFRRSP